MYTGMVRTGGFRILISLMVLLAFMHVAGAQEMPTISVCEVFENLDKLSGELIAVHGEFSIGRHDDGISQQDCAAAPETKGHKWPTAIHFVSGKPTALRCLL